MSAYPPHFKSGKFLTKSVLELYPDAGALYPDEGAPYPEEGAP